MPRLEKSAIIGVAAFVSGLLSRWLSKTITLSAQVQRNYPELQKRVNGWLSVSLKVARILTVCVAIMLLLNARDCSISELAAQRRGGKDR